MTDQGQNAVTLIEPKISLERASAIAISDEAGGLDFDNVAQLFEVAKMMAQARVMVPAFLQGSPWDCLAIILQAREWRMSPFQVARMAYLTENKRTGEKQIGFMAQLIHAVLEARAPIKGRMAVRYEGEGDNRVCIVSATLSDALGGETKEHRSPRLGDRRPEVKKGRDRNGNDYEYTPGSPLWITKPDVQLAYDTQRDFARIYFPDILMGVYADDELKEVGFDEIAPRDLARMPAQVQQAAEESLSSRLSPEAAKRAGFNVEHVVAEVETIKNGDKSHEPAPSAVTPPTGAEGQESGASTAGSLDGPPGAELSTNASWPTEPAAPTPPATAAGSEGGDPPPVPSEPTISAADLPPQADSEATADSPALLPGNEPAVASEPTESAPSLPPEGAATGAGVDASPSAPLSQEEPTMEEAAVDSQRAGRERDEKPVAPPRPTDDASYYAWVVHWAVNEVTTRKGALDRWREERKMRTAIPNLTQPGIDKCKVVLDTRWPKEEP